MSPFFRLLVDNSFVELIALVNLGFIFISPIARKSWPFCFPCENASKVLNIRFRQILLYEIWFDSYADRHKPPWVPN